jgi:hypothetical protein
MDVESSALREAAASSAEVLFSTPGITFTEGSVLSLKSPIQSTDNHY